ncbi:MAG: hypothetical protein AAFW81_04390 [Pseudomonadota bacterium]
MEIAFALLIMLSVYVAPAIALRPRLIADPAAAAAIPFVGIIAVFLVQSALVLSGLYASPGARLVVIVVAAIAAARLFASRRELAASWAWTRRDAYALGVALALGAYVFLRILENGFNQHDEIYSWNLWALQQAAGTPPDFTYTAAPYPQLFPKLLSFKYLLMGSTAAQLPVKASLVISSIALFYLLGAPGRARDDRMIFAQAAMGLFLMKVAGFDSILDDGMPDTMMTAAIVASIFFYVGYEESGKREALVVSALCASVAVLLKQPAIIWAAFALPVLFAVGAWRGRGRWRDAWLALLPAFVFFIWTLTEGRAFHANDGVVAMSMEGRSIVEQLIFTLREWVIGQPALPALALFAAVVAWRKGTGRAILALYAAPAAISWLIVASYDVRAGAPAIAAAALVAALGGYGMTAFAGPARLVALKTLERRGALFGLVAAMIFAGAYELHLYARDNPAWRFGETQTNNLIVVFADDAPIVSAAIDEPGAVVWTPTPYVYGLFYDRAALMRPQAKTYTPASLLAELRDAQPDFVDDGGVISFGPAGPALASLARACPDLFDRVAGPATRYKITLYRVDRRALASSACAP